MSVKHALNMRMKMKTWIVDIDGTLALKGDRGPFDWSRVGEDQPNEPVIEVVCALWESGYDIIFMSGRMEQSRKQTELWLDYHVGFGGPLFMRADDDFRPDNVTKKELYELHVQGKYDVIGVIDDRASVVKMWREELGLTVLDVAGNTF